MVLNSIPESGAQPKSLCATTNGSENSVLTLSNKRLLTLGIDEVTRRHASTTPYHSPSGELGAVEIVVNRIAVLWSTQAIEDLAVHRDRESNVRV